MSLYRGAMLGLQSADTAASLQSRRLLQEIAARHQTEVEERERVLAMRQQTFEAGRLVGEVTNALQAGAPAADAYYVAVRTRPLLAEALDEALFPELQDKSFLHQVKTARAGLESAAGAALTQEQRMTIERLVWLERVIPAMKALGAWREILRLMQRWRPAYWTSGSAMHVGGMLVFGWLIVVTIAVNVVGLVSKTLASVVALPGFAWVVWGWASIYGRMTTGPKLKALAAEAGLIPYDRRMTTSDARQIIYGLKTDLLRLEAAPGDSSGDAYAEAARLEQERASLHLAAFTPLPSNQ